MPKSSHFFKTKYLRSEDHQEPLELTVDHVSEETMPDGARKPVMYFEERQRGLVLNKANFSMMEQLTKQPDSDDWGGTRVLLDVELVSFKGEVKPGLRLHPIRKKQTAAEQGAEIAEELDDEIPGGARSLRTN